MIFLTRVQRDADFLEYPSHFFLGDGIAVVFLRSSRGRALVFLLFSSGGLGLSVLLFLSIALIVVVGIRLMERTSFLLSGTVVLPRLELPGVASGPAARPCLRALVLVVTELSTRVAFDLGFVVLH